MKKLFYFLSAFFLISFITFQSCKKDKEITKNNLISNSNSRGFLSPDYYSPPSIDSCINYATIDEYGLIKFGSRDSFINCLECLQRKTDKHLENFHEDFGHLFDTTLVVDTSFGKIADSLSFSEDQIFIDFENHFDLNSYRQEMENEILDYVSEKTDTNWSDFPTAIIADIPFQTILNQNRLINFNDTIYYLKSNDFLFYLTSTTGSQIDSLVNGQIDDSHPKIYKRGYYSECECFSYINESDKVSTEKYVLGGGWYATFTMEHDKTNILGIDRFSAVNRVYAYNNILNLVGGKTYANFTIQLKGLGRIYRLKRKECIAEQYNLTGNVNPYYNVSKATFSTFKKAGLRELINLEENKVKTVHNFGRAPYIDFYYECPY